MCAVAQRCVPSVVAAKGASIWLIVGLLIVSSFMTLQGLQQLEQRLQSRAAEPIASASTGSPGRWSLTTTA